MYRIKPNGNYNLVIADIKFSVNATQVEGKEVEKKLFDSSSDAKRLVESKLLLVEDASIAGKQSVKTKDKNVDKEQAFVVEGHTSDTPTGVFIKDVPEKNKKPAEVKKVESLTKDTEDQTVQSKATVAEPKVEKEVVKTETKEEAKKVTNVENEDKKVAPATKKPAPKNTKTTK